MEDESIIEDLINYIKQDLDSILQSISKKYSIIEMSKNKYNKGEVK